MTIPFFEKRMALEAIREQFRGTDSRSQCSQLLEGLAGFSITTFEAMRYLDIYHRPARVLQLRQADYKITTHWQTVETEGGAKHRVGLYAKEAA